jgi:hypothetical protein
MVSRSAPPFPHRSVVAVVTMADLEETVVAPSSMANPVVFVIILIIVD